jgi:[acyl-carrier-protein] S-malonyltransferase
LSPARSECGSRTSIAATVAGVPVWVDEVDAREDRLRACRLASSLPRRGTSEGRQLRRWLTQLLVTERVVAAEAATRELTADGAPSEDELLPDTTTRLEIGSIAASLLGDALARALFVSVTAAVDITDADVHDYRERNPRRFGSTAQIAEHLRGAARRRAFRRWLDARCAELVELAPGYEHPGDPRQPDNTHRH